MKPAKAFSVLLCCYGDFPQYSIRAVSSILENAQARDFDVHVGCSACGATTTGEMRGLFDVGEIETLVESKENINKDPMMRLLLARVETDYVLWLDDDTHLMPGWDGAMRRFIGEKHPFDAAGHVFYCERSEEYLRFLRGRPWWADVELKENIVWFPTGGFFLARKDFLTENNFPDLQMVKRQDDLLLGDLIVQKQGILLDFGHDREIMDRVKISDGERRGAGEGSDGWL